jgi:phosphopantothenoylcysteine decarboxylase/phosphopantothenate--cysteine ligase
MPHHPANELIGIKSHMLYDKKIVLGITGSIAAVETVKLAHELIRHGATVYPVLTKAACEIISPEALRFASGNAPITKLTGDVEHVKLCGLVNDKADLLLIAPCTANTISKIACGIDDTTVTTFATTAIGSKMPVIIVPAMHSSMYDHKIVQDNIKKLENMDLNIEFINPSRAENKRKLPAIDEIVSGVIRRLWKPDLGGNKILIIAGATAEPIDDMRILTNKSTGYTGIALARLAFYRGGDVTLWLGKSSEAPPDYIDTDRFGTVDELKTKVSKMNKTKRDSYDIIIVCAGISDYTIPKTLTGKLPSGKSKLELKLIPTTKIIELIRKKAPKSILVGFKAEANQPEKKIIENAHGRLSKWKLDMIVANDITKTKTKTNEIIIITPNRKQIKIQGKKETLADTIFDSILAAE